MKCSLDRPNILVLCTDQQRYDALGVTSQGVYRTPTIDYLAGQGVLFRNCYAQSTVCAPARASLATGKYLHSHGLWANGVELPVTEPIFTRLLAQSGYRCGWIGKRHLGPAWGGRTEVKRDDGISDMFWSHDPRHPSAENAFHHWLQREHPALFEAARNGELLNGHDDPELSGFDCLPAEASYNRWVSTTARDVLAQYQRYQKPWFLWVNFFDPHHPFYAPEEFLSLYPLESVAFQPAPDRELVEQPDALRHMRLSANAAGARSYDDYDAKGLREVIRAYRAMVSHVDHEIGRILEAIDGPNKNTVTVFLSDHGEMLGEHGLLLKGPAMYEGAVKVPFIISWPEHIATGLATESLVQHIDLPATLLEVAGQVSGDKAFGQGSSILDLAKGVCETIRNWAISEYRDSGRPSEPFVSCTMLREDDRKIIVYHSDASGRDRRKCQVFNLVDDPGEVRNLCANGDAYSAGDIVGAMLDRLVSVERREAPRVALW